MSSPLVKPDHDYLMPHNMLFKEDAEGHCPPNCPRELWRKAWDAIPEPVVSRATETPDDFRTLAVAAARHFMESCCLTPTPDAIEQLVEVFLPCLEIMCDPAHPWDPNGGTWRKSGILGAMTDAKKKWERFWERTWKHGKRHDDSGFDLINYIGFVMRSNPDSGWGSWGPPGVPEEERQEAEGDFRFEPVLPHPMLPFPDEGTTFKGFRISPSQLIWPDGPPDPMTPSDWVKLNDLVNSEGGGIMRAGASFDDKPSGEYPPPPPRGSWPAHMEAAGEEVPPLPRRIRPVDSCPSCKSDVRKDRGKVIRVGVFVPCDDSWHWNKKITEDPGA